jgi:MFS family permease
MIGLAGVTSFFVGNAFQAQMPEYAHYLGGDETGVWYSVLLAANAAGAVLGVLLLESANVLRPGVRTAIVCAGIWATAMGLFAIAQNYQIAVALLVLAGVFNIAFTSIAQTLVQILAPATVRGSIVGLFNTAILGLRAGSGLTVGVLGTFVGVRLSLVLSALMVVIIVIALFVRDVRMHSRRATAALMAERHSL